MEQTETEVKFHVANPDQMHERLLACGAVPEETVLEINIRLDDADHSLRAANQLLRLRQDRQATLTYKTPPAQPDDEFKTYTEIETTVGDFEAARRILAAIGFAEVQRYEKQRRTYRVEDTHLCLDTMPYGVFLEIEGEKKAIRRLAADLELPWEDRILANYLEMFAYIRKTAGLPFTDVTFDNFTDIAVDLPALLTRFQVGKP